MNKGKRIFLGSLVVIALFLGGLSVVVAQDMKHTPYLDSEYVETGLLLCDADGCQGPDEPVQLSFWEALQDPNADRGELIAAYMVNARVRVQQHLGL